MRQSEFAAKHNLRPNEVAELRRKHLAPVDVWSEGRTIYWTGNAVEKVEEALAAAHSAVEPPEPITAGIVQRVRIIKLALNSRFVYGDLTGERISIFCGKHAKRILGKVVDITTITRDGETKYIYQP